MAVVSPDGSTHRTRAYARAELEALRGTPSEEEQAWLWGEVRAALTIAGFSAEYDGLLTTGEELRIRKGSNKGRKAAKRPKEAAASRLLGVAEVGAPRNGDLGVHHEHHLDVVVVEPSKLYQIKCNDHHFNV